MIKIAGGIFIKESVDAKTLLSMIQRATPARKLGIEPPKSISHLTPGYSKWLERSRNTSPVQRVEQIDRATNKAMRRVNPAEQAATWASLNTNIGHDISLLTPESIAAAKAKLQQGAW